jgi:hypothetical protein
MVVNWHFLVALTMQCLSTHAVPLTCFCHCTPTLVVLHHGVSRLVADCAFVRTKMGIDSSIPQAPMTAASCILHPSLRTGYQAESTCEDLDWLKHAFLLQMEIAAFVTTTTTTIATPTTFAIPPNRPTTSVVVVDDVQDHGQKRNNSVAKSYTHSPCEWVIMKKETLVGSAFMAFSHIIFT